MALMQGTKTIEVNVLMKSKEQEMVEEAQNQAIEELNREGKRAVHIEKSKRTAGFGELGGYYVSITILWETDTEELKKKEAERALIAEENRRKEIEREIAQARAAEAQRKREEYQKKVEEHQTELFWEKHRGEKDLLTEELNRLKTMSDSKSAKMCEALQQILKSTRTSYQIGFSIEEKILMKMASSPKNMKKVKSRDIAVLQNKIEGEYEKYKNDWKNIRSNSAKDYLFVLVVVLVIFAIGAGVLYTADILFGWIQQVLGLLIWFGDMVLAFFLIKEDVELRTAKRDLKRLEEIKNEWEKEAAQMRITSKKKNTTNIDKEIPHD